MTKGVLPMGMPTDIKIIDLMLNVPGEDNSQWYEFMKPLLMDQQSREMFKMPAQYMFKDIPQVGGKDDYIAYTVEQMDRFNIERRSEEHTSELQSRGHLVCRL